MSSAPAVTRLFGRVPSFSFEFFPPRSEAAAEALHCVICDLQELSPSFVSVTYGAGGSSRELTRALVERIQRERHIPTVPHITCIGHSREEIEAILENYVKAGARAVLALKGDPPRSCADALKRGAFEHAAELVRFIRRWEERRRLGSPLTIGVAGFCEGHPAEPNRLKEMDYLKEKMEAGANYICTQLFFDNHAFFDFRERCRMAGITQPILAGIMPVTSVSGMRRMAELSGGTNFPARLLKALRRARGDAAAIEKAGIHYASSQCAELLDNEVDGIHFYTLNKSRATREIYRNLGIRSSHDANFPQDQPLTP
ncbi:MAG: methylenetetrahydrofolate reductase [NAD(P)H] [Akkermansiaceae bacterium]|nr:methylenetetrahydrofolate reductase [NAD(P)H] [Akkermansiaceae bacterium]